MTSRGRTGSAGDPRRQWLQLVELMADQARRTIAGERIDEFDAGTLRRLVGQTRGASFPVPYASNSLAATGALILAEAFIAAGTPARKLGLASVLQAAAAFLDAELTEQGHALAQQSRRVAGDDA